MAQNYMVVDSEKVFKSIDEYNKALQSLDKLAADYQKDVDALYELTEQLYNNYIIRKESMSAAQQQRQEQAILAQEKKAEEFQKSIFDSDGELMKRRVELIAPIQKRVFAAIELYANSKGYDLVLDLASNPTILYKSADVDQTQGVIDLLAK